MKLTANTWLTADTHFGHKGLVEQYQQRPEGHEDIIIKQWNKYVQKDDTVLHLGDLAMTNKKATKKWTDQLKGKKFLIRGNHDGKSETWFNDVGFTTIPNAYIEFLGVSVVLTHEPIIDLPKGWYNIHGHLHGNSHRPVKVTERHFDVGVDPLHMRPITLFDAVTAMTEKMRAYDWLNHPLFEHIEILDPDGWDRRPAYWKESWEEKITSHEMMRRVMRSTIRGRNFLD